MAKKTITELIMMYFTDHEGEELSHGPVVDWVTEEWLKTHKEPPRDIWRSIRALHEKGVLIKVKKGVHKYDSTHTNNIDLEDFSPEIKEQILKRDGYRCVICGRGLESGFELQVDHIKPKSKGGKAIIDNGQTLCSIHNFRKKTYDQTETGKKMFILLYKLAKKANDENTASFCRSVLNTFEDYHINDHIEWDDDN